MPYFEDTNGGVHYLSDTDVANGGQSLLPSGSVSITDAQAAAIQNPPLTPTQAQTTQLALMDATYAAAETADIAYMGTTFQADDASQTLITKVLSALGGASPAAFAWADKYNVAVSMTNAQLQGLSGAILMRDQPLFWHCQAQKATIRAALTVADVQAVVW